MRHLTKLLAVLAAFLLLAAACSESDDSGGGSDDSVETEGDGGEESEADDGAADDDESEGADDGSEGTDAGTEGDEAEGDAAPTGDSIVEMFAGEEWFFGTVPDAPVAADDSLEPITIGMVNLENSPAGSLCRDAGRGSMPPSRSSTPSSAGVDGRPVELVHCITEFSPEASQACAQEMVAAEVVALVGGIDITSNASFPVYEQNGLAQLGGIPANLVEQQSPSAFFFSGGTPGGMAAFMKHAYDNGAETVLIGHGEFDSFTSAANDYGAAVGRSLGMEVDVVAFPVVGAGLPARAQPGPADRGRRRADARRRRGLRADHGPVRRSRPCAETSQLYMFGACALEEVVEAAGDSIEGVIFGSEGPSEQTIEGDIFDEVTAKYATLPAQATGTVGFRGMMNLYDILLELGADGITKEAIRDVVANAVDRPSYWGHPYTCDGNQVPGLPALCAPQQTYMTVENGEIVLFGDWVDTPALFAAADIPG